MPDDEKPNPFEDVRKGLGLLFRAAKSTVERLPTKDLEEVVVTSAREVGRALENVGRSIEREVIRVKDDLTPHGPGSGHAPPNAPTAAPSDAKRDDKQDKSDKTDEPPKPPPEGGGVGSSH
jgi:hypothetical protein